MIVACYLKKWYHKGVENKTLTLKGFDYVLLW